MTHIYGSIEAGGTKFVCAVGSGPDDLQTTTFPTTTPQETLRNALAFFTEKSADRPLRAMGIGAFGPIDLNRTSPTWGHITSTPKPGWAGTDFVGTIQQELNIPVGFDTDVNVAALGEHRWGAAQNLADFLYLTIGTGVGGGGMSGGRLLHGLVHPEMGHIPISHRADDCYAGCCPFHHNACLEGLACGPAINERWGRPGHQLPADHPAWELEAHYLAQAMVNFICTLSPRRIILGGGVMKQPNLLPLIRSKTLALLNGYVQAAELTERIDTYLVPPALADHAGVLGGIALAEMAA